MVLRRSGAGVHQPRANVFAGEAAMCMCRSGRRGPWASEGGDERALGRSATLLMKEHARWAHAAPHWRLSTCWVNMCWRVWRRQRGVTWGWWALASSPGTGAARRNEGRQVGSHTMRVVNLRVRRRAADGPACNGARCLPCFSTPRGVEPATLAAWLNGRRWKLSAMTLMRRGRRPSNFAGPGIPAHGPQAMPRRA